MVSHPLGARRAEAVLGGSQSSIRTHVLGHPLEAPATQRAAFRALISTDGIKDELQWLLADGPRGMRAAFGPDRRTLLFTPVRNDELVSVFGVHEDDRDQNAVGAHDRCQ